MKISIFLSKNKFFAKLVSLSIFIITKVIRKISRFFKATPGNNIVVVALHRLGDSVLTLPTLKIIKKHFNRDIYIFCYEEAKPIFELFFKTQEIISFEASDFYFNKRMGKSIIRRKLQEINPGKIFDLTGATLSTSILFNSVAPEIIGINEEYYKPVYTKFIPMRKKPHLMDIYLDTIRSFMPVNDNMKNFSVEIHEDSYILIHPFAGWKAKEWNFYKFINLADLLNKKYSLKLFFPPTGIEFDILNEIISKDIEVRITKDIYELIELIKNCSLMVSNDSGPIHIASMLGKPTFTLYGPTNPDFSIPFGGFHRYIKQNIKCSPEKNEQYCFTDAGRRGCSSFECMNALTVNYVYDRLLSFLIELKIKKKSTTISID